MFMSFFRDVIRPTFLFITFIFILGMIMDAVASTTLTIEERIQTLSSQTNATSKAQLEQALRLLERLEAASTTNYIDKVFKPQ